MLESCPHCSAQVLFTSDYCPSCHRSRTDGSMEAGFVAALPLAPLAPSTSRKLRLLPFCLAVLLIALGCVVSHPLVTRLGCFLLAAGLSACALFIPRRGYRVTASLLVIVALVSAYMAYRHSVKYFELALHPLRGTPLTGAPNKRAGGDGGIPVVFHAGFPWPAAPHHGRWARRTEP